MPGGQGGQALEIQAQRGKGRQAQDIYLHPLIAELVGGDRAHAPALMGLAVRGDGASGR